MAENEAAWEIGRGASVTVKGQIPPFELRCEDGLESGHRAAVGTALPKLQSGFACFNGLNFGDGRS